MDLPNTLTKIAQMRKWNSEELTKREILDLIELLVTELLDNLYEEEEM